jgi:hypothetical protein
MSDQLHGPAASCSEEIHPIRTEPLIPSGLRAVKGNPTVEQVPDSYMYLSPQSGSLLSLMDYPSALIYAVS